MEKSIIQRLIDAGVIAHKDIEQYMDDYNKQKSTGLIAGQIEQPKKEYSVIENGVLIKFDERDLDRYGHYKMPMEVYEIGKYAFSNCKKVRTVILSPDVRYIAERAFFNCGLQFIDLCNVRSIGGMAFSFCLNLQAVEISQYLKVVGDAVFYNCMKLERFIEPYANIVLRGSCYANRADAQEAIKSYIQKDRVVTI